MTFRREWCCMVLVSLIFCAVSPAATAPQSDGTIQREGFDLQRCGVPKVAVRSRITDGEVAIEGHWPWHGALFHQNDYQCGCTLINELFVLTASHCVYDSDTGYKIHEKLVHVRLGMQRLSANGTGPMQSFAVRKIIPHAKFVPNNHKHDVALLRLNGTVQFTNHIQPVCLDLTETIWVEYLADVFGTVVGWGLTEKNRISDELLKAELPIVRYTDCVESNPDLYGRLIYSGMYCAGILNGTSPCNGDSGGGMYIYREKRWFLRGVVSFSGIREGTNYCDSFSYVVFMNVPYYVKWIATEVDAARDELLKASSTTVKPILSNRWDSYLSADYAFAYTYNTYSLRMEMDGDSSLVVPPTDQERARVWMRSVRCGETVTLSCKQSADLANTTIRWFKVEDGARTFLIENETLIYRDVRYHHAGEYWCQVADDTGTLHETGMRLSVTRVPIRFQQGENASYVVHDALPNGQLYTQFSFEMTFRTNESDALLFHKPPIADVESWSYSLLLERNRLTLRIIPPGQSEKVFRSVKLQLQPTRWHTVLMSSYDGQGLMALDGQYLLGFEGHIVQHRADRYYIANAPGLRTIGFSGCVNRLMINDKVLHLERDLAERINVGQCEFCNSDQCNMSPCPAGQQHSCINYVCSEGRCDGPDVLSPEDDCDFGAVPYTRGVRFQHNSYASYRSFLQAVLTVDLQLQLHSLTDGIVFHTAEHRRGFGKFITILVKAGRIELRFTTDAHLHTIYLESSARLVIGRWYRLQAGYRDGYVYLQVDDEQEVARSVLGTVFPTDRQLVVFVGGVRWQGFINRHKDVKQGLDGCIKRLKLSGLPVDLVDDMVESANIRSCLYETS